MKKQIEMTITYYDGGCVFKYSDKSSGEVVEIMCPEWGTLNKQIEIMCDKIKKEGPK